MSTLLLASLIAIPVFVLAVLAVFTYYDAQEVGMDNPRRWAAIVFFIPAWGFIVYLLTRSELDYDPETDPYRGGKVNVHPSRADDVPWNVRTPDAEPGAVSRPTDEPSAGNTDVSDSDDPRTWDDTEQNEWGDPVNIEELEERDAADESDSNNRS